MVRVIADNGTEGVASGDAMIGFDRYKHLFVGESAFNFERHNRVLESISLFAARCWPLDLALWDLLGKVENKPVYQILGGTSGKLPLYASTGVVRPAEELSEQACMLKDMGFKAIKIRIGQREPYEDVEALQALRKSLGDDMEIMVDANQAWRMPWDISPWVDLRRSPINDRKNEGIKPVLGGGAAAPRGFRGTAATSVNFRVSPNRQRRK